MSDRFDRHKLVSPIAYDDFPLSELIEPSFLAECASNSHDLFGENEDERCDPLDIPYKNIVEYMVLCPSIGAIHAKAEKLGIKTVRDYLNLFRDGKQKIYSKSDIKYLLGVINFIIREKL